MRNLTSNEISWLVNGHLPCGHTSYFEGPCGGAAMNIKCTECDLKLNVVRLGDGFFPMGEVLEEPKGYVEPPAFHQNVRRVLLRRVRRFYHGLSPRRKLVSWASALYVCVSCLTFGAHPAWYPALGMLYCVALFSILLVTSK